jgi:hypothetical protein
MMSGYPAADDESRRGDTGDMTPRQGVRIARAISDGDATPSAEPPSCIDPPRSMYVVSRSSCVSRNWAGAARLGGVHVHLSTRSRSLKVEMQSAGDDETGALVTVPTLVIVMGCKSPLFSAGNRQVQASTEGCSHRIPA